MKITMLPRIITTIPQAVAYEIARSQRAARTKATPRDKQEDKKAAQMINRNETNNEN
jgi:hypothetical protein